MCNLKGLLQYCRYLGAKLIFIVHSLLLVDAMQTFGPNFELLVASHRSVMVDSMSGSLKGSDPVSPCSPSSPNPASPPDNLAPVDLAKALSDLQNTTVRILPVLFGG